jgi:uncharacterized protein YbaR (Trm112 family)
MQSDICPKCKGKFVVAANRAHPAVLGELMLGEPKSSSQLLTESALVKCPHCSHAYASDNVRFFGVLTRRQLSGVLLFFVTSFAAVAIYLAVTAQ